MKLNTGCLGCLAAALLTTAAQASTGPCTTADVVPISTPFSLIGGLNFQDCNSLVTGKLADLYSFSGTAGEQVKFTLNLSHATPYLILRDPTGTQVAVNSSAISSSTITLPGTGFYVLQRTGTYVIEVTTSVNTIGSTSYTLSMETGIVSPGGSRFVPVTPCRVADTRNPTGAFGGPVMFGGSTRSFPVPQSACGIPSTAVAYSLNVTVVPGGPLSYLTIWPAGQSQPLVSTLNSFGGGIVANAAIVPAGLSGAVSVYVTNTTDVILDINGYFDASGLGNAFYAVTPCRVSDTRNPTGSLGGPSMLGGSSRGFPVQSTCGLPVAASAYSLNATVVPGGPLSFLTLWPAGFAQPLVSTLNSPSGSVVANAAIVPAGSGGLVNAYVTNTTDLILDVNGYFAPPGSPGGLQFYPVAPCRISDTRNAIGTFGGPALAGGTSRNIPVQSSPCGIPNSAQAYSLNVTVVPQGPLYYLTMYPAGQPQPVVSTLNSFGGSIVANAAIVPAGSGGSVAVYVTNPADVIIDINGYFAP